jgi:hypothetical protein
MDAALAEDLRMNAAETPAVSTKPGRTNRSPHPAVNDATRLALRPTILSRLILRMAMRRRSARAIVNSTREAASCSPNVCQSIGSTRVVSSVPGRGVFEISAERGSDPLPSLVARVSWVEGPNSEVLHRNSHSHGLRAYR